MRFKDFYLTEAAGLKFYDLNKSGPDIPMRGVVLIKKLEKNEPFEMMDDSFKQLHVTTKNMRKLKEMVKNKNFEDIVKTVEFLDTSGNIIPLSQIKKNKEFGSSGGITGGVEKTKVIESATAVMAAYLTNNKMSSQKCQEYFNSLGQSEIIAELNKVSKNFNIDSNLKDISELFINDPSWLLSTCQTAETINKELKPKASHVFHRSSNAVKSIYGKVQELLKQAGYRINNDRWNPADIWMIDESSKTLSELQNANNILDFNRIMVEGIKKNKDLYGISLKKTGKGQVPVKWFNLDRDKFEEYINIEQINPKVLGIVPMAKDVVFLDNKPPIKMYIRDFVNRIGAPVSGELKGKKAMAGKVGYSIMVNWLKKNVIGASNIKVYRRKEILKDGDINPVFIQEMFNIISRLQKKKEVDTTKLKKIRNVKDLTMLIDKMKTKKGKEVNIIDVASTLSSKIQAFQIALYADDDFFDYVTAYASSHIKDISGPFIKIGE